MPGVLALLPEYAGLVDPVAELRAACLAALAWLGDGVVVVADAQGARVAVALLAATGHFGAIAPEGQPADASYLVVANGSARRSEKAPGHLDERAFEFDQAVGTALRAPDPAALARVDASLGEELLAGHVAGLHALGELLTSEHHTVSVDYDDDPFGVQYWVMRWTCES
ncbi:MAG: hypothetical protein JWN22_3531 [Nocardioides sp.]|nr:hypothetical protein [Nocardioides sp.]